MPAPSRRPSRTSTLSPTNVARFATRHPRRVLTVWGVLVLVSIGLVIALLSSGIRYERGLTNNPDSSVAKELIRTRVHDRSAFDEVIIVRSHQRTVADPAFAGRVRSLIADARASGSVSRIGNPLSTGSGALVSADRHAVLLPVVLKQDKHMRIADLVPVAERANGAGGFAVHITGRHTLDRDFGQISERDLRKGELEFGLPVAMLVLLLVFGTAVGAAIPMLMAVTSILVALGVVALVSQVFKVDLFITNMIVAMGLALGIDYSLFILSRVREERRRGRSTPEAVLTAASTATRAVVFSGIAFALSMIGMLLVPDTTLRSLGLGAVVVALVSIAAALTAHPAMLMLLGDRVDRLPVPWLGRRVAASAGAEGARWRSAIGLVMRRPVIGAALATAVLLALASPVLGLKTGAAGSAALPDTAVAKQGLIALGRDFPSGTTSPVTIVVDESRGASSTRRGLARLRADLAGDTAFAIRTFKVQRGPRIAVASVDLTVQPETERASEAVDALRSTYVHQAFGSAAHHVFVGGTAAEDRDSVGIDSHWLPLVIAFVLALTLVLLTLAFRAITVALTAVLMNLLSVGAAYGVLVLVFQDGVGGALLGLGHVQRIEAWVPIFLFSVLFGLSMDYQVFLLSRIQEHRARTGDTNEAIVHGVASTARLITGAAAIIVVVFSGFATGQLVAFQEMGLGVAVALALDATLVRLLLTPALMRLLGERNWYLPQWLQWLPRLSVEGPTAALRDAVTVLPQESHSARGSRADVRAVLTQGLRTPPRRSDISHDPERSPTP